MLFRVHWYAIHLAIGIIGYTPELVCSAVITPRPSWNLITFQVLPLPELPPSPNATPLWSAHTNTKRH